jgi:hypothetical protein
MSDIKLFRPCSLFNELAGKELFVFQDRVWTYLRVPAIRSAMRSQKFHTSNPSIFRMVSSGLLRRVRTDVSEEPGASLIRVTKIGEEIPSWYFFAAYVCC